jgi:hypothetical protein
MKKTPSTLAQQIEQAQKTVATWSESRKMGVRLQGSDVFLNRASMLNTAQTKPSEKPKR